MTTTLTDNELRVLRREVIDEVVRDRGRISPLNDSPFTDSLITAISIPLKLWGQALNC